MGYVFTYLGRQAEVMGRAATELAIQLLGGQHRLTPTNMHQVGGGWVGIVCKNGC